MFDLLWTIPAAPLTGFLLLILLSKRISPRIAALVGVGLPGLAAVCTIAMGVAFLTAEPAHPAVTQTLWTWLTMDGIEVGVTLYLDTLSLLFMFVITFVGFLILIYAVAYMKGDDGFARFFAFMNLFLFAMLVLVLGDNLLLLYLGWEGVGLSSFLLIGFWYTDPANGRAARKAFIVTRIGDVFMAAGLLLIFTDLGTLNLQTMTARAVVEWGMGSNAALAAALLLLGGAVGKSAQLPLQTWLPDAMAGPTPVSALIHAATMVTAGVYLIARTHGLFVLAPAAMTVTALLGTVTLLMAGFSALTARDIKRILAYSTMSQVGYMFLALGVGAWSAAVFHFMTHAFFKALLFMGAGAIILALHHEQDIYRMGGLRKQLPAVFRTFLVGAASLAALPLVTAGFYSKDLILWHAWSSPQGGPWFFVAACAGAVLTALYTFRMVFVVFFGETRHAVEKRPGRLMIVPLSILAVLALVAGFVETPEDLGHITVFADVMHRALPKVEALPGTATDIVPLQLIAGFGVIVGLLLAYVLFLRKPSWAKRIRRLPGGDALHRLFDAGFGFDSIYDRMLVRSFVRVSRALKGDVFNSIPAFAAQTATVLHLALSRSVSGRLRGYAAAIAVGAILLVAAMVFS